MKKSETEKSVPPFGYLYEKNYSLAQQVFLAFFSQVALFLLQFFDLSQFACCGHGVQFAFCAHCACACCAFWLAGQFEGQFDGQFAANAKPAALNMTAIKNDFIVILSLCSTLIGKFCSHIKFFDNLVFCRKKIRSDWGADCVLSD